MSQARKSKTKQRQVEKQSKPPVQEAELESGCWLELLRKSGEEARGLMEKVPEGKPGSRSDPAWEAEIPNDSEHRSSLLRLSQKSSAAAKQRKAI